MSTVALAAQWLERASDYANPILVKEMRQALKSRQFVTTFMLLLVASWLISVFGILMAGDALEYGSTGRTFFGFYYCVLATAIFAIVPFGAYRSLLNEREQNTYELLCITALKPRQIVWGKLLSAMAQVFIFYSAIAPFIAFTSLLQGFDLAQVVFVLVMSFLLSVACSMIALMLSTVTKHKTWRALMSLILVAALVWIVGAIFSVATFLLSEPLPLDDPNFWWGVSFFLMVALSYFILAQQITTAQLTFESDNRCTGIRVTCAMQFWLLWITVFVYAFFHGAISAISKSDVVGFATISVLHWTIVGLFAVTEHDSLSRRIRRDLPRSRLLRWLIAPFMPGGSRGMLYFCLHILATWLLAYGILYVNGATSSWASEYVTALCCYAVVYLGFGVALGRAARVLPVEIRPTHIRVMVLLLFAIGVVVPHLPYAFNILDSNHRGYSLIYITNPFETLSTIAGARGTMDTVVYFLLCAAALAVVVNSRAMLRGSQDILTAKAIPRTPRLVSQRPHTEATVATESTT